MADIVTMTYGSYDFGAHGGPIPFLTISKIFNRADDGTKLSTLYNVTLDGTLTPLLTGTWGYSNLDAMQDRLMNGFSIDGQLFEVTCNSNVLISEYPRINSVRLDKSQDNWYQTTPYVIEMEWDGPATSGNIYVESAQESWNVEISDESTLYNWTLPGGTGDNNNLLVRVSHAISAKGLAHYSGGVLTREAWKHAQLFCISKMGYDTGMVRQTGVLNLPLLSGYNHMRVVNIDELGGTYSINESWLATTGGGCGTAIEDFTATVTYNQESALTNVSVAGSIQGLETVVYEPSYSVVQNKYDNASGYWNCVKNKLFGRAQLASSDVIVGTLNPSPLDLSIGKNPTRGVINYSYAYDSRPCNFLTGAIWEQISITDNLPTDIFASIVIPGRGAGTLLQDIGTTTSHSRSVDINALMSRPTGCGNITTLFATKPTAQVNTLLCQLYNDLASTAGQIFVSNNSESFDVKTGRYSRSIAWTVGYCSGEILDTDVC